MIEKRVLLVGDGNHQFITNYAKWIKKEKNTTYLVDILSLTSVKEENKKYYSNTIGQIDRNRVYRSISNIKGIRRYYRFYKYKKIVSRLFEYDIIHFHYINIDSCFLIEQIKRKFAAKLVVSIWGSDLYRLKKENKKFFLQSCLLADCITFSNKQSKEYFENEFNWANPNLFIKRFGLAPLENLKKNILSKSECKRLLGLDENKISITVGYNLSPAQQHLKIIEQLKHLNCKSLFKNVQFIFPITYGGTLEYKKILLEELRGVEFEYKIFDEFLSDEKIALIRKCSNIMIQLQETDQFSGSMQEHLFAENVVITGSWLPYETLKESGAWFLEVDSIDELSLLITSVINNLEIFENRIINNPKAIIFLSSWDRNIKEWLELYI